jgi:hypothetical protein
MRMVAASVVSHGETIFRLGPDLDFRLGPELDFRHGPA